MILVRESTKGSERWEFLEARMMMRDTAMTFKRKAEFPAGRAACGKSRMPRGPKTVDVKGVRSREIGKGGIPGRSKYEVELRINSGGKRVTCVVGSKEEGGMFYDLVQRYRYPHGQAVTMKLNYPKASSLINLKPLPEKHSSLASMGRPELINFILPQAREAAASIFPEDATPLHQAESSHDLTKGTSGLHKNPQQRASTPISDFSAENDVLRQKLKSKEAEPDHFKPSTDATIVGLEMRLEGLNADPLLRDPHLEVISPEAEVIDLKSRLELKSEELKFEKLKSEALEMELKSEKSKSKGLESKLKSEKSKSEDLESAFKSDIEYWKYIDECLGGCPCKNTSEDHEFYLGLEKLPSI